MLPSAKPVTSVVMEAIKQAELTDEAELSDEEQTTVPEHKIYNRLEDNFHLSNKKALFWNMAAYYRAINKNPYDALPLTFHVTQGINDVEYGRFLEAYNLIAQDIRAREIEKE